MLYQLSYASGILRKYSKVFPRAKMALRIGSAVNGILAAGNRLVPPRYSPGAARSRRPSHPRLRQFRPSRRHRHRLSPVESSPACTRRIRTSPGRQTPQNHSLRLNPHANRSYPSPVQEIRSQRDPHSPAHIQTGAGPANRRRRPRSQLRKHVLRPRRHQEIHRQPPTR